MSKFAFFCIPAHGHTNPMLGVARALCRRGHQVRFYSFEPFREKIERTGAEFVSCDRFLPDLNREQEARLTQGSTTEMTIQDLRTTMNMNSFLEEEIHVFRPDVIYTDAVCFWGKLTARKYGIPMVVSTSTFAFNQVSSQYQKHGFREMADLMLGLPKVNRELKKLDAFGYHERSLIALVSNDNSTDTVVYTSKRVQPCSETFSSHYTFVGPSLLSAPEPSKAKRRPLVYISMGTVMNNRPDFYANCIVALKEEPVDVVLSCGRTMDINALGILPENVRVYPQVDQLEVLSRADVFITHCGMNSFSESLYMATPMVLYPQTGEQRAVARRAAELGVGVDLKSSSAGDIRAAVRRILDHGEFASAAMNCCRDLRACSGAAGAADFIETAPHAFPEEADPMKELNRKIGLRQLGYWVSAMVLLMVFGILAGWNYAWLVGVAAGILNGPFSRAVTERAVKNL